MEERLKKIENLLAEHENRLSILEGARSVPNQPGHKKWYRTGSTVEKIIKLLDSGFFNQPRTIADIISELRTKDFHFEAADLTLPLRNIVRKGLLNKTKKKTDGTVSSKWMYAKG